MSPIIFPGSPVLPPAFPIFGGKPTGTKTQHSYSKPEKSTCPNNQLDLAISQVVARVFSFHFSNFQYPLSLDTLPESPKTTQFSSSCQVSPTPAGNGKDETTSGIIVNLFQKVLVNMIFYHSPPVLIVFEFLDNSRCRTKLRKRNMRSRRR